MLLDLPFPDKVLWPNGRGHHMAVARAKKSHKAWAFAACMEQRLARPAWDAPGIRLVATFHPKTAHAIDKDNASASLKAYADGIAAAIGINDKHFAEPKIEFGEPVKGGRVFIVVEAL